MPVAPPVKIDVRPKPSAVRGELAVRYAAAYLSTLIALAAEASAPGMSITFIWTLVAVTLLGLPMSLALRLARLRVGGWQIPHFVIGAFWSSLATIAILLLVVNPLQQRVGTTVFAPDFLGAFFNRHDAEEAVGLILQAFSIIMVCRCLVIINDKDTVLSTVPAFCVLVLLIVVERKPGVVFFFVLWAATAAVLFALDHRQETGRRASAFVPAFLPGQGTMLSARTLGGVMVFSLLSAMLLSYTVTSRIEDRSIAETWISSLAGQLTRFATALPDVSVNAGPERQIDYTTGPSLPTRSPLWRISARDVGTGQHLRPNYWRMFTLAHYSGTGWSQAETRAVRVPREMLGDVGLRGFLPRPPVSEGIGADSLRRTRLGYNILKHSRRDFIRHQNFGVPIRRVRQQVRAARQNLGYVPHLPAPLYMDMDGYMDSHRPDYIAAFNDQSVDVRFIDAQQGVNIVSAVPPTDDYGVGTVQPPLRRDVKPNPGAQLSREERRLFLRLPVSEAGTPDKLSRVRAMAAQVLGEMPAEASDYARAMRLAEAVQNSASYTLRPPPLPPGKDATDFFLFESRRGYCTYFAGALVILCRSAGIPARVVNGFTAGELRGNGSFEVREANAHAWSEVWVPNWGWATVDATPPGDRGDNAADWWTNWVGSLTDHMDVMLAWVSAHKVRIVLLLCAAIAMSFVFLHERATLPARRLAALRWKRRRVTDTSARETIDEVYERMAHTLEKRFRPRPSWETPHEWLVAAQVTLRLKHAAPLFRLTELWVQARYSPRPLGASETEEAWQALSELKWEQEVPPKSAKS